MAMIEVLTKVDAQIGLCIERCVLIVAKIAKFLLSQAATSRFFAVIALVKKRIPVIIGLKKHFPTGQILEISRCSRLFVISAAKIAKFLFAPSSDKPVFCSDCFEEVGKGSNKNIPVSSDQYKKQFEMLNSKLDNILQLLSSKPSAKKVVKEEKTAVKVIKKTVNKKTKKVAAPKKPAKKSTAKKKK